MTKARLLQSCVWFLMVLSVFFGCMPRAHAEDYAWTSHPAAGSQDWNGVASSSDGTKLAAEVNNGDIFTSTDAGNSWTNQTNAGSRGWSSIASSSDGTYLAAAVANGDIYTSADSGVIWTDQTAAGSRNWYSIASSSDGSYLIAAVYGGGVYVSSDHGTNWTLQTGLATSSNWDSVAISSDGSHLFAVSFNNNQLWTSTNYGSTWSFQGVAGTPANNQFVSVATSSDGSHIAITMDNYTFGGSYVYTSSNSGSTWSSLSLNQVTNVTMSADGSHIIVLDGSPSILVSSNSGASWVEQYAPQVDYKSAAISSDGSRMVAVGYPYSNVSPPIYGYISTAVVTTLPPGAGSGLDASTPGSIGEWKTASNVLQTGFTEASSVVYNGYLYEIGGIDSRVSYAPLNSDGSVGSWVISPNSLPGPYGNGTAAAYNGYVYYLGGAFNMNIYYNTVYYAKLNPDGSIGTWQLSSNSLPYQISEASTIEYNGYLYEIGGWNHSSGGATGAVYYAKLNPDGSIGTWQLSSNGLGQQVNSATAVEYNGYVYVLGGSNGVGNARNDNSLSTVYYANLNSDGSTGAWQTSNEPLPLITNEAASVEYDGFIYEFGGWTKGYYGEVSSYVYFAELNSDGSVGAWHTSLYNLPSAFEMASANVYNGYAYVLGGFDGTNSNSNVYYTRLTPYPDTTGSLPNKPESASENFFGRLVSYIFPTDQATLTNSPSGVSDETGTGMNGPALKQSNGGDSPRSSSTTWRDGLFALAVIIIFAIGIWFYKTRRAKLT